MLRVHSTAKPFDTVIEIVVDLNIVNVRAGPNALEGDAVQLVRIGQAGACILDDYIVQVTGIIVSGCAAEQTG